MAGMLLSEQTSQSLGEQKTETFLSYNRNDSAAVSEVARELKQRGVNVWMDESNLAPGERWQNEITSAFERADCVAVCIGGHGLGGWQKLELEMVLAKHPERGTRIVPIVLPDAPRTLELPAQLSRFTACDLRTPNRTAQLDNVSAVMLADSEWPVTATRQRISSARRAPGWLQAFFQSDGKTLDPAASWAMVAGRAAIHDPAEPVDE